jgi:uncharacterized membrane protein YfcA
MALSGVAVFSGGVVQRVTGLGFSLVCVPFLVLLRGPLEGVRLVNVLACVVGVGVIARAHVHVRWRDVALLIVPALVVGPIAGYVARNADQDVLQIVIGIVTLSSVIALASGVRVRALHGPAGAVAAGGISAAMNTMSGVGGPTIAMFGLNAGWEHDELRGTMAAYFLGLNAVSIASLGLPRDPVPALPLLGCTALGGVIVGGLLAPRVPAHWLRTLVLIVAAVGSVTAIAKGLF